jgi:rhodanese-related sulfurtransferase
LKGGHGSAAESRHAEAAASRFDAAAFDIREASERQGDHSGGADYRRLFAKARAASALQAALSDGDPQTAARTALYEARHAIADDGALVALIDDQLAAS